jgi:hypothetical protein
MFLFRLRRQNRAAPGQGYTRILRDHIGNAGGHQENGAAVVILL